MRRRHRLRPLYGPLLAAILALLVASIPPQPVAAAVRKLNTTLATGGTVGQYAVAPGNTHVVYIANQDNAATNELFSVPLDGGATIRLNPEL
ncbi:MAG: hypothetical protein HC822_05825, partial [Oscillochloris sp.]|nr:hypothetical protein [Oscillochloris sp.]